ncbi:sensor histidine kinase [Brevibacillus halotolerans]|uniref:sensor histidine kinase n=1 Tax=Brevibacillus halotolerans TaxID=1507437 RepID=UPI0015EE7772|nr:histidine kinase [Brevibacillus halotolerans]MBA4534837.1 sensor histidine kinase [Brevibacillus halotolerans]
MNYRWLKLTSIMLPTIMIGGFEYARHEFLLPYFTMDEGNVIITIMTLVLSFIFATWVFGKIKRMSEKLAKEKAKHAVYEERERLAQELHDNIAQAIFFLNVKLNQEKIEEAKATISEIDNQLRQAIFNLRSHPEEGVLLTDRLRKWLHEWSLITGIEVKQELDGMDQYFKPAEQVHLFSIIQESFTNIRKHADASHAKIQWQFQGTGWYLLIKDNGMGFDTETLKRERYGQTMMRERSWKLGASFEMRPGTHGGTEILIESFKGESGRCRNIGY